MKVQDKPISRLADRMVRLSASKITAIADKARQLSLEGRKIYSLAEGELEFDTPDHIKESAISAIRSGETKYTSTAGTPALKRAIAGKLERENGLSFPTEQIIAGAGAKQMIFNALLATLSPGDRVVVPAAYWVSYRDMVSICEGEMDVVACSEANGFKISPGHLAAAIRRDTRWFILNSPSNPTGAVYDRDELRGLADVLLANDHVLILSDDIYEHIVYDGSFESILSVEPRLKDRTLVVNGVSKGYAMTGWRLGYAAGPRWLVSAMEAIQSQSTNNASSISQAAAVAALTGGMEFLDAWLPELLRRRQLVKEAIEACAGVLTARPPQGGYYFYVNCAGALGKRTPQGDVIGSDLDFTAYLLERSGIAVVPGAAFGMSPYFRIVFTGNGAELEEVCKLLVEACNDLV